MKNYLRKINYYETDQMKIVHHSNYIRYFEEARCYFLDVVGYPYEKLEDLGIISPVLSVSCEYKKPILYGESINIEVYLVFMNKVKFEFEYRVLGKCGDVRAIGKSSHCFLNSEGKVISIEKYYHEFYDSFLKELDK